VKGGANDYWQSIVWNGFRPRAGGLDQPVTFADSNTTSPADSTDSTHATPISKTTPDTSNGQTVPGHPPRAPIPRPTPPRIPVDTAPAATQSRGWTVSFAAFVSEAPARKRASEITADGQTARVVASQTNGTTVYRVVLGPYPTKADAERVGRESRQSFWVYEGNP
jgi:cell division septation protein DedD